MERETHASLSHKEISSDDSHHASTHFLEEATTSLQSEFDYWIEHLSASASTDSFDYWINRPSLQDNSDIPDEPPSSPASLSQDFDEALDCLSSPNSERNHRYLSSPAFVEEAFTNALDAFSSPEPEPNDDGNDEYHHLEQTNDIFDGNEDVGNGN